MKNEILKNAKSELEVIELAKVQGFDQGAVDKLVKQWLLDKETSKNKITSPKVKTKK